MPDSKVVRQHYTHGGLVGAIRDGVEQLGKSIEELIEALCK
jgi:hypothetical protein